MLSAITFHPLQQFFPVATGIAGQPLRPILMAHDPSGLLHGSYTPVCGLRRLWDYVWQRLGYYLLHLLRPVQAFH